MSALLLTLAAIADFTRRAGDPVIVDPKSYTIPVAAEPSLSGDSVVVGPVGSINLALLADGVAAWPDLSGSQLRHPPAFLNLLPLTIPQWQLPVGVDIKFSCPDTSAVKDICEAWVFFYSCPLACTTKYQGGMPGLLSLMPGWERSQCAPRMVTGAPGASFEHPMRAFRRQLARGESTTITIPGSEKAEFLVFGTDAGAVDCSQHTSAGSCQMAPDSRCKWDASTQQCRPNNCKAQAGPWQDLPGNRPSCPECPWQGLVPRPGSDGPFSSGQP